MSFTGRAGGGYVKEALLSHDFASSLAGSAYLGGGSLGGSGAVAFSAYVIFLKNDFFFLSVKRVLQGYFNVVAEASSLGSTVSAAAAASETEKVFKNIAETGKYIFKPAEAGKTSSLKPGMPESIIQIFFLRISEYAIGLRRFFKTVFRLLVTRIPVGMIPEGEFAISFFNFSRFCGSRNSKCFVIISLGHFLSPGGES
jgi:hypothetical protein